MKITVNKPTEINVTAIRCVIPIRYDLEEEGIPSNLFGLDTTSGPRPVLTWVLDIETGRVRDWPEGLTASIHTNVCDEGSYSLMAGDEAAAVIVENYVPDCVPGGFGDYFIATVGPDGAITMEDGRPWKPSPRKVAKSFFPG